MFLISSFSIFIISVFSFNCHICILFVTNWIFFSSLLEDTRKIIDRMRYFLTKGTFKNTFWSKESGILITSVPGYRWWLSAYLLDCTVHTWTTDVEWCQNLKFSSVLLHFPLAKVHSTDINGNLGKYQSIYCWTKQFFSFNSILKSDLFLFFFFINFVTWKEIIIITITWLEISHTYSKSRIFSIHIPTFIYILEFSYASLKIYFRLKSSFQQRLPLLIACVWIANFIVRLYFSLFKKKTRKTIFSSSKTSETSYTTFCVYKKYIYQNK